MDTLQKSWNKLQILEAGTEVIDILRAEEFGSEYLNAVQCALDDLMQVLEGKLRLPAEFKPPVARQHLLVPGIGFVPVLGQVLPDPENGNRVEWYRDDDGPEPIGEPA